MRRELKNATKGLRLRAHLDEVLQMITKRARGEAAGALIELAELGFH